MELREITGQVLNNCRISDSQYAGMHSICGLALRMRDLYKWEKGLDPWVETDSQKMLDWIGEKENEWDDLTELKFGDIDIEGNKHDPFDTCGINASLEPYGLFYGAGYARALRPTFFLSDIEDKKNVNGHMVYILGKEHARDLLTLPALVQDDCVLIRKESGLLYFWDQIFFVRDSSRRALDFALKCYGLSHREPEVLRKNLRNIFKDEIERYVHHELGELKDTVFDRNLWREIIAAFPHTPIELLARAIKDLLADTNDHGTLSYIIKNRKAASLAFHVAFLDGLARELFIRLPEAFMEFSKTSDWHIVENTVTSGHRTFTSYAGLMVALFQEGKKRDDMKWAANEIEKRLLAPLGLGRGNV